MTMQYNLASARRSIELFQLAERWSGDLLTDTALVECKMDGFRAGYWRGLDGKPKLWTRNGHPIEGTGHIIHVLSVMEHLAGEPMFFDGEFIVGGTLHATKAWHEREWKSGEEAGTLHLFDAMSERKWRAGGCYMPLIERKARLQALHVAAADEIASDWSWREGTRCKDLNAPPTLLIQHDVVAAATGVHILATKVWAQGGEGVMIKDPTAVYTRGRNRAWSKLKRRP